MIPKDVRERFYFVIVMPVNKRNEGPINTEKGRARLTWEVWTQEIDSVASFDYLADAIQECERLNGIYYEMDSI